MGRVFRRWTLRVLAKLFSEETARKAARWMSRRFVDQIRGRATKDFLKLLLRSLDMAFCLDKGFRVNIEKFRAHYRISTADRRIDESITFRDGDMRLRPSRERPVDVEIRFTDAGAIRKYLFSERQDILDSLLNNSLEIRGNVNYIYKFGFLAKELEWRLGLA